MESAAGAFTGTRDSALQDGITPPSDFYIRHWAQDNYKYVARFGGKH